MTNESFASFRNRLIRLEKKARKISSELTQIHSSWENCYDEITATYPEKWRKHCEKNGIVSSYRFGDVIA